MHVGSGRVYVYFGGDTLAATPDVTAIKSRSGWRYGYNALAIADVNGDGYKDLIVNSEYYEDFEPANQLIDVFFGGPGFIVDPDHPDQQFDRSILPPFPGLFEGRMRFINIMDVNNDGKADFVTTDADHLYAFYGGANGFSLTPDRVIFNPDSVHARFGGIAHQIRDINGDGFDDYLVTTGFGVSTSRVLIYLGGPSGMESYPVAAAFNPPGGQETGLEACTIGDIDGDGLPDFAVHITDGSTLTGFAIFGGYPWKRTPIENPVSPGQLKMYAYPNPCMDFSTIVIGGVGRSVAEAIVYDLLGREIRRLHVKETGVDESSAFWDGRDARGYPVPPGQYTVVVRTASGTLNARILKQR